MHGTGVRRLIGRVLAFNRGPLSAQQDRWCHHWLKVLAITGVPLAIAFHGGVGALFSTLSARAIRHTPLMPILFLTGALVSGGGLMAFVVAAFYPDRGEQQRDMVSFIGRAVLGLLLFDVVLEWAEFSVPMWYGVGHEYELLMRVLFGDFWWVFWIVHVGLGCVVPVLLLVFRGNRTWSVGIAGLLVAFTFMTVRLNIVIPGLLDPSLRGLQTAFTDHRLIFWYVPSFFEWQVTMFIVAVGCALFYLGFRFLPLVQRGGNAHVSPVR
jgi:molybdopterin-containing oxidoreductase family membrane subunit